MEENEAGPADAHVAEVPYESPVEAPVEALPMEDGEAAVPVSAAAAAELMQEEAVPVAADMQLDSARLRRFYHIWEPLKVQVVASTAPLSECENDRTTDLVLRMLFACGDVVDYNNALKGENAELQLHLSNLEQRCQVRRVRRASYPENEAKAVRDALFEEERRITSVIHRRTTEHLEALQQNDLATKAP